MFILALSSVRGGRIECTMQNVADMLVNRRESPLSPRNHGERRNQCWTTIVFFFDTTWVSIMSISPILIQVTGRVRIFDGIFF